MTGMSSVSGLTRTWERGFVTCSRVAEHIADLPGQI